MFAAFAALFGRFFYLQVVQHRHYQTLAETNRIAIVPIVPNRGVITDRNGVLLGDVGYSTGDHRLAVQLKAVAPTMVQATVAIEDKGFYTNPGFDAMAILRAIYDDLRTGHIVSGASTTPLRSVITPRLGTIGTIAMRLVSASVW